MRGLGWGFGWNSVRNLAPLSGGGGPAEADYNTAHFNQSNGSITTTYNAGALGSAATISIWAYYDAAGSNEGLLGEWGGSKGIMFFRPNAGGIRFYINSSYTTTYTISTGAWHHLVGTYDGTTMRLYVDGSEVATKALAGSITDPTSPTDLEIGRYSGFDAQAFGGMLTMAMVWSRVLTPTEVSNLYQAGKVPYYETLPSSLLTNIEFAVEMSSRDSTLTDLAGSSTQTNNNVTFDGELKTFTPYA